MLSIRNRITLAKVSGMFVKIFLIGMSVVVTIAVFVLAVGALIWAINPIAKDWSRWWQALITIACMVVAAAFVGWILHLLEKRAVDPCYYIDQWIDSFKPRLWQCHNNSVDAYALDVDFQDACRQTSSSLMKVHRILTFSNEEYLQGRVTGTKADANALLNDCFILRCEYAPTLRLYVPRTSGLMTYEEDAKQFPTIPLDKAYELVWGK